MWVVAACGYRHDPGRQCLGLLQDPWSADSRPALAFVADTGRRLTTAEQGTADGAGTVAE